MKMSAIGTIENGKVKVENEEINTKNHEYKDIVWGWNLMSVGNIEFKVNIMFGR